MSRENKGVGVSGKPDRATHEPNPQAVSALRVGIADAALHIIAAVMEAESGVRTLYIGKSFNSQDEAFGKIVAQHGGRCVGKLGETFDLAAFLASAIEARQGPDPKGLDAQHESAVPKADAQTSEVQP